MHDAVTFARTVLKNRVNGNKIAVWGIGHSGGLAMIAAALDPRIAAALILMPFTSGINESQVFPMDKVWENRTARNGSRYVPVWPSTGEEGTQAQPRTLLSGSDAWDFIKACREMTMRVRGVPMPSEMSLQSFYHISRIEPRVYLPMIAPRPLLYITAEVDKLTGPIARHREIFETAGEPKEFVTLKDHHLATYVGETFAVNVGKQVDFLRTHLIGG